MAAYLKVHAFTASQLYSDGVVLTPPDSAPNAEFVGFSAPFSPPQNPIPTDPNDRTSRTNVYAALVGIWRDVEDGV